jgi:threonine/homoserine/homoserine lactone efflux protein
MSLAALLIFSSALMVAAASPGPAVAAILARVLSKGARKAISFTAGIIIGDVVWLGLAVLGLAVLAHSFSLLFMIIKYIGVLYLLYLAFKLWTTPIQAAGLNPVASAENPYALFFTGLAVTMGNPKAMMFYLAVLPTLIDVKAIGFIAYLEFALATCLVLTSIFGIYIVLAARARTLMTRPQTLRRLNQGSSVMMAGAALAIAAR